MAFFCRFFSNLGEIYYLACLPVILCLFITSKLYANQSINQSINRVIQRVGNRRQESSQSTNQSINQSIPDEQSNQHTAEKPANHQSTNQSTNQSMHDTTPESETKDSPSSDQSIDQSVNQSTDLSKSLSLDLSLASIDQSINHASIDQSINHLIQGEEVFSPLASHSINQPINQSTHPTDESVGNHSSTQATNQSTNQSINESTNNSANQSRRASTSQSIDEPITLRFILMNGAVINQSIPSMHQSVSSVINLLYPDESINQSRTVKLIYQGRSMDQSSLLIDYNISPNDLIHVMVINQSINQSTNQSTNPSHLFSENQPHPFILYPLCLWSGILGIGWSMQLINGLTDPFLEFLLISGTFMFGFIYICVKQSLTDQPFHQALAQTVTPPIDLADQSGFESINPSINQTPIINPGYAGRRRSVQLTSDW